MASERQLLANRGNALKSTGPKSAEGKQRVSANALKHGLSAQTHMLTTEPRALELANMVVAVSFGTQDATPRRSLWAEAHTGLKKAEHYRHELIATALLQLNAHAGLSDGNMTITQLVTSLRRLHRHERRLNAQLRRLEGRSET
jgi:hypothetical protein